MSLDSSLPERLRFLIRVVRKECMHLQTTDLRLFAAPFTSQTVAQLDRYPDLAERVEAFASRLGRCRLPWGTGSCPFCCVLWGKRPLPP